MKMEILLMRKMVKNWFLIISLLFLGCINNTKNDNSELIAKEAFKNILIDIHTDTTIISEEIDLINNINQDSLVLLNILNHHNYSYELYQRTLSFYIDKPEEFIQILTTIKDSLSR